MNHAKHHAPHDDQQKRRPGPPDADISWIERKELDIPYANRSDAQKLDLYLPDEPRPDGRPYPLLMHIHGGAFMMCDKRDVQVNPWLSFLADGYAVASVNYRMSGEALFPAAVHDVKAALRFLRANAARWNIDPWKIAAVGGSAGGNLSAMLASSAQAPAMQDDSLGFSDVSVEIQACVEWFGPTDFLLMDEQLASLGLGPCDHNHADSPESRYLGMQITKLNPSIVQKANPMNYIDESLSPLLIEHGDCDHLVPYLQSDMFYREIERKLGPGRAEFIVLKGADHGDRQFESPENMAIVREFLKHRFG